MENFEFYAPTRMIFGKGTHLQVGKLIREYGFKKVLVHFGGGSVKKSGLLDQIQTSLKAEGIAYVLFGGVQANPVLSMAREGIALCRKENVDFVLAVGGGSVIDSSKCIADGAGNPDMDVWKFHMKEAVPRKALPVGVILTLAAAGSEMSASCVITNEENGLKRGFNSVTHRPLFSICNPELTYTVSRFQTGCGTVDIMMHTLERYFIPDQKNRMTDEIAEGLLRTVIDSGRMAMKRSDDYDAMSELMWCGSLSHNNLTGLGREKDFSVHKLGHALSARFDCAHGATLASVWGAWAWYVWERDIARFAHYAKQVWGIERDEISAAKEGIERTIAYFEEIGMPTSISGLGIGVLEDETLKELALDATMNDTVRLSLIRPLSAEDVLEIFRKANY